LPKELIGRKSRKALRRIGIKATEALGPLNESGLVLRRTALGTVGRANSLEEGVNVALTQWNGPMGVSTGIADGLKRRHCSGIKERGYECPTIPCLLVLPIGPRRTIEERIGVSTRYFRRSLFLVVPRSIVSASGMLLKVIRFNVNRSTLNVTFD
jgi:hypothetical protein